MRQLHTHPRHRYGVWREVQCPMCLGVHMLRTKSGRLYVRWLVLRRTVYRRRTLVLNLDGLLDCVLFMVMLDLPRGADCAVRTHTHKHSAFGFACI
jgi:hypothetical protein